MTQGPGVCRQGRCVATAWFGYTKRVSMRVRRSTHIEGHAEGVGEVSWRPFSASLGRLAGLRIPTRGTVERALEHPPLVRSLIKFSDDMSSAQTTAEMLAVVADHAKSFTGSEKVVLVLVDSDDLSLVDSPAVIVRGRRDVHDESVWASWLDEAVIRVQGGDGPQVFQDDSAHAWMLAVPMRVRDAVLGVLAVVNSEGHGFRDEHIAYLSVLGSFAAGVLESARLADESRYSLIASERERIAAEMHDGIAQSLFGISLGIESCKKLALRDPAAVVARLEELEAQLLASMSELRRYIYDLRPVRLRELGVVEAIRCWLKELTPSESVPIRFEVRGEMRPLDAEIEACIYRVAREGTLNAIRHARARAVDVVLAYDDAGVALFIDDDGQGFDVEAVMARASAGATCGLRNIADRVRNVGGTVRLESAPGRGTRLRVRIGG